VVSLEKVLNAVAHAAGFDVYVARDFHSKDVADAEPLFQQGWTPDDWEINCGRWHVVVSRIRNRKVASQ
jgi:hypothetical protein